MCLLQPKNVKTNVLDEYFCHLKGSYPILNAIRRQILIPPIISVSERKKSNICVRQKNSF